MKRERILGLILIAAPLTFSKNITIMPLGDSITKGEDCLGPSYRFYLDSLLRKENYGHEFVGSRSCAANWDTKNEGHGGWTTEDILSGKDSEGSIYDWAPLYKPDIVLIHLGTNDIGGNIPDSVIIGNLGKIIGVLRNSNPNVIVFLAKIIPMSRQYGFFERGVRLNSLIGLVEGVHVVDQFEGMDSTDFKDAVHPNASGYSKMALKWNSGLLALKEPTDILPRRKKIKEDAPHFVDIAGRDQNGPPLSEGVLKLSTTQIK